MSRSASTGRTLAISAFVLLLTSCAAFEGRETAGQYIDDATITAKVKAAFIADPQVKAMQVNVETMEGAVQLSGFVDSTAAEVKAVQLAEQVRGVKLVKDSMVVVTKAESQGKK